MASSLENDLEELLSCAICLGTLSEPKLLPCSHRFCKLCIIMEMDRSATPKASPLYFPCPLCKREIKLGRGRNGEEWVATFETDRLLKDIQDLLQQEKEDSSKRCLSHRKKRSLVCYSCGTTGCYICAWLDHRYCSNVKNFQAEAEQTKRDLQNHLKESEKCIEKMVPYVTKWSSVRKSLKNQRDYSNRFIEERLQHLHQESVSAVEELVQDYECYITRNRMSTEIEKELRRLMETFPIKINGSINIFNKQSGLQSQNETIILPEIREASERLEIVKDVQMLISTIEDIRQILDLSMEEMVLKGKTLLTQKAKFVSKTYRDNLVQQMNVTPPRVVQDSLVTRPEQIGLGNERGASLFGELNTALQHSKSPKELVETTGRLCFPDGYHSQFDINPLVAPKLRKRQQPNVPYNDRPQKLIGNVRNPAFKLTKTPYDHMIQFRIKSNVLYPQPREFIMKTLNPMDSPLKKKLYVERHRFNDTEFELCILYPSASAHDMNDNKPEVEFCSYNSLLNKANGEPFPTMIEMLKWTLPASCPTTPPTHFFKNGDDEDEGLECERQTCEKNANGLVTLTIWKLNYKREGVCAKLFWKALFICILFIIINIIYYLTC